MSMHGTLTDRQAAFVDEYIVDLNGTQAALRAGFSPKSAAMHAVRMLRNEKIAAAIREAMQLREKRTRVTADRVLIEIERLAMWDPADVADVKSPEEIKNLPEEVRRAIVGWTWTKDGRFVIKLAKERGLEMLARHHSLFNDKLDVNLKSGLADRLRKARERARGD